MIKVKKEGVILQKTVLGFENQAVLNPAVIREGNTIHLFYRAVKKGNYSSIGYCTLSGPLTVEHRLEKPLLFPQFEYESQGVEDPRIVKIEDTYYLTYTAYDGVNAMGALAISKDLIHFEKQGLITARITYEEFKLLINTKEKSTENYSRYNESSHIVENSDKKMFLWDKNILFFPRKINNKFCFIHRIKPNIQIVTGLYQFEDLTPEFWRHYFLNLDQHTVLHPKYPHEISYIGGGCPPIETTHGWLLIYHGVKETPSGYVYCACAALLDLEHPEKEIARLPYPLFKPEMEWELKGEVNNVCFPTGTALFGDTLYIYYGAADEQIACASVSLFELVNELIRNISPNEYYKDD